MNQPQSEVRVPLGTGVLWILCLASCSTESPAGLEPVMPPPGPPALIYLTPRTLDLLEGKAESIIADVREVRGRPVPATVEWSSNNPAVATVDAASGVVRGVSPGAATITARAGAAKGVAQVSVVSSDGIELAFTEVDVEFVNGTYIATANLALYQESGIVRLTLGHAGSAATTPVWSPDGSRVAYALVHGALGDSLGEPGIGLVPFEAGSDLYVAGLRAEVETRRLTFDGWSRYPDWSPDGRSIVHVSGRPGANHLQVLDVDGAGSVQLGAEGNYRTPRWSPDGLRIAFAAEVEGQDDIFIMDRRNGGITNLTAHPAGDVSPTWSPDGKRLAFISTRFSPLGDLFVLDLESRDLRRVTGEGSWMSASQPAWSPGGEEIAFTQVTTTGMGISAIRPDGTGLRRITTSVTGYPDYFAAWRRKSVPSPSASGARGSHSGDSLAARAGNLHDTGVSARLHVFSTELDPPRIAEFEQLLAPQEIARDGRFQFEADRARYVARRAP